MTIGSVCAHLTFALVIFLLLPTNRLSRRSQLGLLIACAALSFVPIDGLSLGDYVRSYMDDLAITTLLWLLWCTSCRFKINEPLSSRHHLQLALCFVALALFLYPATLGLSQIDPYRLGFSPLPLLLALWLLCVWLWMEGNRVLCGLIAGATAAFALGLKTSTNYWDYLIDPILFIYCVAHLIARLQAMLWRRVSTLFLRRPPQPQEQRV